MTPTSLAAAVVPRTGKIFKFAIQNGALHLVFKLSQSSGIGLQSLEFTQTKNWLFGKGFVTKSLKVRSRFFVYVNSNFEVRFLTIEWYESVTYHFAANYLPFRNTEANFDDFVCERRYTQCKCTLNAYIYSGSPHCKG